MTDNKTDNKRKLRNISKHKWTNPNAFNAITAIIAFLVMQIVFLCASPIFSPLLSKLSGEGAKMALSTIISQFLIIAVAWIFCKIKHVKLFGGGISLKANAKICLPALALTLGTLLFLTPLHQLFADNLDLLHNNQQMTTFLADSFASNVFDLSLLFVTVFILSTFLPAICEEALFRSVIMNGFKEFGNFFAILASGFLFALMHGNYAQLILQFIGGCEIAFVVLITNNYFAGMVMHFAHNSFSIVYALILYVSEAISPAVSGLITSLFIIIGLVLICLAIIYYYKLCQHKKKIEDGTLELWQSFPFYAANKKRPCCLLEIGADLDCCFAVDEERVLSSDNKDFMFFAGRKFHKFSKTSNKKLFKVLFITGSILSILLIIIDFFR